MIMFDKVSESGLCSLRSFGSKLLVRQSAKLPSKIWQNKKEKNMKKRILCLLLVMIMLVSALSALTACGGSGDGGDDDEDLCANGHTYTTTTGKCDVCKKKCKHNYGDDKICDICSYEKKDDESEYPEVSWADQEKAVDLFFMMSKNSSGESLPSGCERYLAGEDRDASEQIDTDVWDRNSDAEYYTHVKLTYDYYADIPEYTWGKCHDLIYKDVAAGGTGKPDMYCNFTYDMVGASIKGAFANLKNTELKGGNYFSFLNEDYKDSLAAGNDRGYMYDYMESVTLSQTKMYLLASDYFTDMIRAFYVVPVNVALLESVGMKITGDRNGDKKFTLDDFYLEVENKEWTYDKVATYSQAVYKNTGSFSDAEDIEDILGWCSNNAGFVAPGFVYSTDVTIINKVWDDKLGDYKYSYPVESTQLYDIFDAVTRLHESTGVYCLTKNDTNFTKYGSNDKLAIAVRSRFCDNKILFGGIIMVGALEVDAYQQLKGSSGFGVVPVPLYESVEKNPNIKYLTSIHNAARPGAISRNVGDKFAPCTAFLDYQSTHSTEILDAYYNRYLCVKVVDAGVEGTVRMLQYIRSNVRSAFDKTFEDALGIYDSSITKWASKMALSDFICDIRQDYQSLADKKTEVLNKLYLAYFNLP